MKVVAISGYFNPIHSGHIKYIQSARYLGDYLIVIVNSDDQVVLKGSFPFQDQQERVYILSNIRGVDLAVLSIDKDETVCKTLEMLKPDVFAKGGDRKAHNTPEKYICDRLGIEMVFNVGGEKTQSSSALLKNAGLNDISK